MITTFKGLVLIDGVEIGVVHETIGQSKKEDVNTKLRKTIEKRVTGKCSWDGACIPSVDYFIE